METGVKGQGGRAPGEMDFVFHWVKKIRR